MMQALGIVTEDAVQGAFRTVNRSSRSSGRPKGWQRAVGGVWLVFWLFWTTPGWNYPIARQNSGRGILPFTLLGWIV